MSRIKVYYNVLEEEGNKIINYAKEYDTIINLLKANKAKMKESWISSNADMFNNKVESFYNGILTDQSLLARLGNLIIKTQEEFRTDQEAFVKEAKETCADVTLVDPNEEV